MAFVPIVLSLLVLAAHFLRGGALWIAVAVLGVLGLLFIRRAWVARLIQVVLLLAALEWTRPLVVLAMRRSEQGEPFLRLTLILGGVVAVTLISAVLFETKRMRRLYRSSP